MELNLRNRWLPPRTILESSRVNGLISDAYLAGARRSGTPFGVCAAARSRDESTLTLAIVFPDGRQAQADVEWNDGRPFLIERSLGNDGVRRVALPDNGLFAFGGENRVVLSDSNEPQSTIPFALDGDCLDMTYMSLAALRAVDTDLDTRHEELFAGLQSWLRAHRRDDRIGVLLWLATQISHEWNNPGGSPATYCHLIDEACVQMHWLQRGTIENHSAADLNDSSRMWLLRTHEELESRLWEPGNWCRFDPEYVRRGHHYGVDFVYVANGVQRRLGESLSLDQDDHPICVVRSSFEA